MISYKDSNASNNTSDNKHSVELKFIINLQIHLYKNLTCMTIETLHFQLSTSKHYPTFVPRFKTKFRQLFLIIEFRWTRIEHVSPVRRKLRRSIEHVRIEILADLHVPIPALVTIHVWMSSTCNYVYISTCFTSSRLKEVGT